MTTMRTASWIIRTKSQPRLRLFCFPSAGGGASIFRLWSEKLPSQVEVCPIYLPGRENRLKEPLFTQLAPLVQTLAHALHPFMDIPFAFFGHSMGALISFELARHLRRIHYPGPVQLFVSAHRAPQLPDSNSPLHDLPDPALIDALSRLGGTPQAVLQHTELMNVMLPILRADLTLCETYVYTAELPLDCPIAVFGGKQDSMVSTQELREWRHQTRSACTLHILPGDHFFLHSQQHLLLAALSRLMSGL
jgi:surfactin synthase thioesterase subunit